MEIIPNSLSSRARARALEAPLHPETVISDWRRDGTGIENMLASPPTQESLRKAMFESDMEDDDRKRLLKGTPPPDIWSNPFSLSSLDEEALGKRRIDIDKGWAAKQADHQKRLLPLLQSLSTCAALRHHLYDSEVDAVLRGQAVEEQIGVLVEQLSSLFHLCAFDLTVLEQKREDLLAQGYSGVDSLKLPRAMDKADWHKTGVGTQALTLEERAGRARALAKDKAVLSKNRQPGTRDPG